MLNYAHDVVVDFMSNRVTWFLTASILMLFLIQPICYLWKQARLTALYLARCVWLSWEGRCCWLGIFAVGEMMFSCSLMSRQSGQMVDDPMFVFIIGSIIYAWITNFIVQCFDDETITALYNIEADDRQRWEETHPPKPYTPSKPFSWLEFNFGWRTLTKITKFVPRLAVRRTRKKPLE